MSWPQPHLLRNLPGFPEPPRPYWPGQDATVSLGTDHVKSREGLGQSTDLDIQTPDSKLSPKKFQEGKSTFGALTSSFIHFPPQLPPEAKAL